MIRDAGDRVLVAVRVLPGAGRDGVAGVHGDELRVRVSAPPVDGRANESVCTLLARLCGVRPAAVVVERGARSRSKVVAVRGVDLATVRTRLHAEVDQNGAGRR